MYQSIYIASRGKIYCLSLNTKSTRNIKSPLAHHHSSAFVFPNVISLLSFLLSFTLSVMIYRRKTTDGVIVISNLSVEWRVQLKVASPRHAILFIKYNFNPSLILYYL